jgi:hypothetical protein
MRHNKTDAITGPLTCSLFIQGLCDVSRKRANAKFCIQYTNRFSLSRENLGANLCIFENVSALQDPKVNPLQSLGCHELDGQSGDWGRHAGVRRLEPLSKDGAGKHNGSGECWRGNAGRCAADTLQKVGAFAPAEIPPDHGQKLPALTMQRGESRTRPLQNFQFSEPASVQRALLCVAPCLRDVVAPEVARYPQDLPGPDVTRIADLVAVCPVDEGPKISVAVHLGL